MKIGRIIIAAVVITVLSALYNGLTCGWLFKWVYALEPASVWMPENLMNTAYFAWVYLGFFILYFFFVLVYARIGSCLPGTCSISKGALWGFIVWLVGMLPGMFTLYMFTIINGTVILYWTLSGLVWIVIAGIVAGLVYGGKEGVCCCRT